MGENNFSDMTPEEKKAYLGASLSFDPFEKDLPSAKAAAPGNRRRELTQQIYELNWVDAGAMSPVKDQMACGACWVFVGVTILEAMEVINGSGKEPQVISTQQGVDCTKSSLGYDPATDNGCNGGWPHWYWYTALTRANPADTIFVAATEDSYPW